METDPPNFNGQYPLAGEKIGPAWRAMWASLSETEWVSGNDLAHPLADQFQVNPETLKNLLRAGRVAGVLEVKQDMRPGTKRLSAFYRVIS